MPLLLGSGASMREQRENDNSNNGQAERLRDLSSFEAGPTKPLRN